ncbi:MAG: HAMP domain-containing sensor histidine kinase [Acidobacteriota bacterium]
MPEKLATLHGSVFVKLVAIMVGMAVCLMLMVVGFFGFAVSPSVGEAVDRVLDAYAQDIASRPPDLETARVVARQAGITISYEGPQGAWTTGDSKGTAVATPHSAWGHSRHVAAAAGGGRYTLSWEFGRSLKVAHDRLLALLLTLMIIIVLVAHGVIRRALRPVRLLYAAVGRFGEGQFDVVVERQSRDELGALTDAFNQMARRVKEMIQLRDRLLIDVSHELRSPLTRMKVALALLPEGDKRTRMEADVAEMEGMITGILELERLRDGRGLSIKRRDIVAIVRDVAGQFAETAPGVRVTTPAEPVLLDIDADKIRVLFRNLLENAVKYSLPDSRSVEITMSVEPEAVTMRVADDGPGVGAGDLEAIFEPFFRADRSRSRKTGGWGLGLAMCKRIIEAHGGRISAENQHSPSRGLVIRLTFPR